MSAERLGLVVEGLSVHYGRVQALRQAHLRVAEGEIVTIVGANGAGKSTLLRTVFGMVRPRAGSIRFDGREIGGRPSVQILKSGILCILLS